MVLGVAIFQGLIDKSVTLGIDVGVVYMVFGSAHTTPVSQKQDVLTRTFQRRILFRPKKKPTEFFVLRRLINLYEEINGLIVVATIRIAKQEITLHFRRIYERAGGNAGSNDKPYFLLKAIAAAAENGIAVDEKISTRQA